jgi:two-component system KDP operon response regulator KdpE
MIRGPHGARILVVDDEGAIGRAVETNLSRHGFNVRAAQTGQEAIEGIDSFRPDLLLLDLGLPDMDGFEIIRRVRERSNTPIVVLSVRGQERDKVAALDLGADDYLTKPFGVDELLARVRVALRHSARPAAGAAAVFRTGQLLVDLERRRVTVNGREVALTPTEYELLKAFIAHPDKVLTDRMLLQRVWGPEYGSEAHYLHVYIARLRKKVEEDPQNPRYLRTEPGVGYRLMSEADERS